MEANNMGNRESEQADTGYVLDDRQFQIATLLALIQMKYQNSGKSPFGTHPTTMLAFTITAYFYTGVLLVVMSRVTRTIPNSNYLPIAMLFSDILVALACSLLIFILVPSFGVFLLFICALALIRALHGSYQQIFELLQQIFKSPYQADSQASNGNSMEQAGNGGVPTTV